MLQPIDNSDNFDRMDHSDYNLPTHKVDMRPA